MVRSRYTYVRQKGFSTCGPACLEAIYKRRYNKLGEADYTELGDTTFSGTSIEKMEDIVLLLGD